MEHVLVTGGTSGIGLELAKNFAKDGYGIIIVSSSSERLQKVRKKFKNEFDISILTYQQDLGKIGAALELYNKIKEDNLTISILVNNAGIGLAGATNEIDLNQDEKLLILNIVSLVELSKLFISDMYKQGHGKVLNVASTGAFQPGPYTSTYFASKAFVLSYSRAVRYEAKDKGVQVCTLCPHSTKTEFFMREGLKTPEDAMSAEELARYGYKQFTKNKEIIVPGLANRIRISRWIPVKLKMNIVARMKSKKRKE